MSSAQSLKILLKWLRNSGHFLNEEEFEISFLSHPDTGSIQSITDVLDEFNIPNLAADIPLCLLILGVLLVQATISLIRMNPMPPPAMVLLKTGAVFIGFVLLAGAAWFPLIRILEKAHQSKNFRLEALSFRRNYHLLIPYLDSRPPISEPAWLQRIELGNPKEDCASYW